MSVIRHCHICHTDHNRADHCLVSEVERLRAEWRKADDGWIACRQQLEGAVSRLEADLGKAADALDVAAAALEEARFPLSAKSARASARLAREGQ